MKLLSIKEAYEVKEVEYNKLSSELRVQVIELREANVSISSFETAKRHLHRSVATLGQTGEAELGAARQNVCPAAGADDQ